MNPSQCHQCGGGTSMDNIDAWDFNATGMRHSMLLNSNVAPSDSDIPLVASSIGKADARLACLDAGIARLHEQLHQLEEEHVALSIYRSKSNAILSPLRRMPPEMLSEIFCWTLPSLRNGTRRGIKMTDTPWVLTHVCSRWRAIAIATPSLWSLVFIVYTRYTNPASSYPLPMVETQIARAQKFKIHFYACEATDPLPQLDVFQCLAKQASRWEDLVLRLTSALFPLLASLRGCLPSLRRSWMQWDCTASQMARDSIDFCESAPSLVDVTVVNEHRFIPFYLPAHQLTRYQLNAPWEIHRAILKQAPNLIEAHVCVMYDSDNPWPGSHESVDLPSLRSLLVSHSNILQFLRFPLLEQITIELGPSDGPDVVNHLKSSLTRSSCPLRSLCLHRPHNHIVLALLQDCPSIEELTIVVGSEAGSQEASMVIQNLTTSMAVGGKVLAPQLSRISFGFLERVFVPATAFAEVVESRWRAGNCELRHAALFDSSIVGHRTVNGQSDRPRVRALREEGLELVFLSGVAASDVMDKWLCRARWT
ncbi:hypothetical protein DFH06DRAFT_1476392 [Mycena polygramma]|nr:hypothetical protein DFH06DRAFT_1476392 [Mycena polygramma]